MNERHIHLFSNAQPELFKNCANDFTNALSPPLQFGQNEAWEVALQEFSCVNTLQSIPRDLNFSSTRREAKKQKIEGDFPFDVTLLDLTDDFPEGEITRFCYPYSDSQFHPIPPKMWSSNLETYAAFNAKVYKKFVTVDNAMEAKLKKLTKREGRYDMFSDPSIRNYVRDEVQSFTYWTKRQPATSDRQRASTCCTIEVLMLETFLKYLMHSSKTHRQYLNFQSQPELTSHSANKVKSLWYYYPITMTRVPKTGEKFARHMISDVYGNSNDTGLVFFLSAPLQAVIHLGSEPTSILDSYANWFATQSDTSLTMNTEACFKKLLGSSYNARKIETILSKFDPSQFYFITAPYHRVKTTSLTLNASSLGDLLTQIHPYCPKATLIRTKGEVSLSLPLYGEVVGVQIKNLAMKTTITVSLNDDIIMESPKGEQSPKRTLLTTPQKYYGVSFGPGSTCAGTRTSSALKNIKVIIFYNRLLPKKALPIFLPKTITQTKTSIFIVPKGVYDVDGFITALNKSKDGFEFKKQVYDSHSSMLRIGVILDTNVTLALDPLLADILALEVSITSNSNGSLPLNLKSFSYNIVVYADFVEESMVGGKREKILRVIPFKSERYAEIFNQEFIHPIYHKVTQSGLDRIRLVLRTDYGESFPLEDGRTYAKLHFRRVL